MPGAPVPFDFNPYSALLLPFVLQGTIVSAVLLVRGYRQERAADYWLALLLGLSTLRVSQWMLGFAGLYDRHDALTTLMFYVPFSNWLAVGPALWFYFRSLTNAHWRWQRRDWWHFLPALLVGGGYAALALYDLGWYHGLRGLPLPAHFGTKGPAAAGLDGAPLERLLELAGYTSVAFYATRTLRAYRAYQRYLNAQFSDTERLRFTWVRQWLAALLLGSAVALGFALVDSVVPLSFVETWYEYAFAGAIIYYVSLAGLVANPNVTRPLAFEPDVELKEVEAAAEPATQPAPSTAPAPDPELAQSVARLQEHMASRRPYLEPELTLAELAAQLRTNATLLSRTINAGCGQNFNDFVNEYRVREAERLLADPAYRHYTLLAVALEAGFNAKSTFNRAFRKLRGHTPSEAAARVSAPPAAS